MTTETKTPRTDEIVYADCPCGIPDCNIPNLDGLIGFARQLEIELGEAKGEAHRQSMQFLELYKLMPEIENQYPDRLYYHLANYLQRVELQAGQLSTLLTENAELKKDKERLRAFSNMIKNNDAIVPGHDGTRWFTCRLENGAGGFGGGVMLDYHHSFKEAIDAAIAKGKQE